MEARRSQFQCVAGTFGKTRGQTPQTIVCVHVLCGARQRQTRIRGTQRAPAFFARGLGFWTSSRYSSKLPNMGLAFVGVCRFLSLCRQPSASRTPPSTDGQISRHILGCSRLCRWHYQFGRPRLNFLGSAFTFCRSFRQASAASLVDAAGRRVQMHTFLCRSISSEPVHGLNSIALTIADL